MWDHLFVNATLCCMDDDDRIIQHGALATNGGKIAWLGAQAELPENVDTLAHHYQDCHAKLITPGLIDCHTHIVYAGNRADEFAARLSGKSYSEIAQAGGGIQATVRATRAASEQQLYDESLPRLQALIAEGVTCVEIKSGYGLDLANEIKILKVAKQLARDCGVRIATTFLGAHTIPQEYRQNPNRYVDQLCLDMLPEIARLKLADAVDVFCENIAFNLAQTARIFAVARDLGFALKCHAEQLSASGAAQLAARFKALSCDHLEYLTEDGARAMAQAGTVAVLLPGAFYYLRETRRPPIELLQHYHIPIALATDANPGTSPTTSLLLMLNMACILWGFTPLAALCGVTRHAAAALGLQHEIGSLAVGKAAEFVIWNCQSANELAYSFGYNPQKQVITNS